ncbi:hypothetical protein BJF78_09045 [Pseudonocardia sp. CNS-139]|nr:hypothetical protein BJF78_09045 [Pseudonocardia sp. CNS-139]
MSGSASTPSTAIPRRASSIATRPVPHPPSSTDAGPYAVTRSASPCGLCPAAAIRRQRSS